MSTLNGYTCLSGKQTLNMRPRNMPSSNFPTIMSMFPAEELKRMMLHLDRFDDQVITEEKIRNAEAADKLEEISEQIIKENL